MKIPEDIKAKFTEELCLQITNDPICWKNYINFNQDFERLCRVSNKHQGEFYLWLIEELLKEREKLLKKN